MLSSKDIIDVSVATGAEAADYTANILATGRSRARGRKKSSCISEGTEEQEATEDIQTGTERQKDMYATGILREALILNRTTLFTAEFFDLMNQMALILFL